LLAFLKKEKELVDEPIILLQSITLLFLFGVCCFCSCSEKNRKTRREKKSVTITYEHSEMALLC
jgi:hypothetical protein